MGILAVAAALKEGFEVKIIDMNKVGMESLPFNNPDLGKSFLIGLTVTAQNSTIAEEVTNSIKRKHTSIPIVWGGEFPSLLPENALEYADIAVRGSFEPIAKSLVADIESKDPKQVYDGRGKYNLSQMGIPDLKKLNSSNEYYSFMGLPVETSRGCDKACTFCMVEVMQSRHDLKPIDSLQKELVQLKGRFVNVVDYNIGVDREHLIQVAETFRRSEVLGWMAELCIESLDDDEVLTALAQSRCRMIYCGIESLDENSLRSINKAKTNRVLNYERIIRKVQHHGIQVGAGIILGLEGTQQETFDRTMRQFSNWGIIYTKLTFITYNPGTKVKISMQKKGQYVTEEVNRFDGNHLTYLAKGMDPKSIYGSTSKYINDFYKLHSIISRSGASGLKNTKRLEFILFALCYRRVYLDWLKYNIFEDRSGFETLLRQPFKKSVSIRFFETALHQVRKINYRKDRVS